MWKEYSVGTQGEGSWRKLDGGYAWLGKTEVPCWMERLGTRSREPTIRIRENVVNHTTVLTGHTGGRGDNK